MIVDFSHEQGIFLANKASELLDEEAVFSLIRNLSPKFSKDGNQYCFCYGEMPVHYVVGFGETPAKAAHDFYNNFYKSDKGEYR